MRDGGKPNGCTFKNISAYELIYIKNQNINALNR